MDKRDFKLTVSRALNVEEIEIKERSLASVKRARLKEKNKTDDKKEFKKVFKEVKIPSKSQFKSFQIVWLRNRVI